MTTPVPPTPPSAGGWTIAKEIPVSVIVTLMLQTGLFIWGAASLTNKLDNVAAQVTEIRIERYTKNDALRDIALETAKFDELNRRVLLIETGKRK